LCGNSNTFTQTINVTIIENTIPISQESCNDLEEIINLNMLISEEFRGQGEWIDLNNSGGFNGQNEGFYSCFGMPIGNYRIEYKVETATCPKKFEIEMNVLSDCLLKVCGDLVIHNAISPNDDGLNDIFTIDNLQDFSCYTSNKVEIYNRWGILVYETNNYDNNNNSFKGISEGRTTINKFDKLPSGTYFYILQYIFEGKSYKKDGYLYLSR
jgi:gliding motility-associated-like protein